LDSAQFLAFGKAFGQPEVHPAFADNPIPEILEIKAKPGARIGHWTSLPLGYWHTDVSYRPTPPAGAMLRDRLLPEDGGDTAFTNTAAAYERLDPETKALIAGLSAEHAPGFERYVEDRERLDRLNKDNPPMIHPLVIVHPETGEDILFVNEYFTTRI